MNPERIIVMTSLLELREKIKLIYSKNEVFILPVVKFLLAFIALNMINGKLGYMNRLDNVLIVLLISLFCSFLPNGCILLFSALISLLHMYSLSMEVALVGLCVYLVMFLLFFRFASKDAIVILLTPLLFMLKMPYVMPIAVGLIGTPASAIAVGCGVVVYYLIDFISLNAPKISNMGAEEATAKLRMVIEGILNNKAMMVCIAAFAITIIVVYLIRRMSIDYSWTIAIIAGAIINLIILLIGDLLYDTNLSILSAILGSIIAIIIGKILEFFRFCVDYSRTEKVQFEDDEYYYYVKAVPKMNVTVPTKTVKRINTQHRQSPPSYSRERGHDAPNRTRSIVTERTSTNGTVNRQNMASREYRSDHVGNRRSVSVNGNMIQGDRKDYDDIRR